MKAPLPTRPRICSSMACLSAQRDAAVASSGKCELYLRVKRRARKRPSTSSGTKQSYLKSVRVSRDELESSWHDIWTV